MGVAAVVRPCDHQSAKPPEDHADDGVAHEVAEVPAEEQTDEQADDRPDDRARPARIV